MAQIYHNGNYLGNGTPAELIVKETVGWTGKNLLSYGPNVYNREISGITFVVNSDGSITVSGTATANVSLHLNSSVGLTADNNYILTGCPSGGATNKYCLAVCNAAGQWDANNYETGDGKLITDGVSILVISITNGTAISTPITFYPMLRNALISDDTYEPYHDTVEEEIEQIYAGNAISGVHNYLYVPNKTMVDESITTTSESGVLTMSGQNTSTSSKWVFFLGLTVKKGTYRFTALDLSQTAVTHVQLMKSDNTVVLQTTIYDPNGVVGEITENATDYKLFIRIAPGGDTTGVKLYPQLALPNDVTDFTPYAMTNRELTEKVTAIDVSSDITINTEQTAYSITSLQVQKIGQLVMVTGNIKSLTEDAVPQGRAFVRITSSLPKSIMDVHAIISPTGSGNQAELYVVGNNTRLEMRGGTVNQAYQFTFTYITA